VSARRTVPPAVEPVTLAEAKAACRASADVFDEDGLIEILVSAARERGEGWTGRGWYTQTWVQVASTWAEALELQMAAPLQSVTSVKYYDSDGVLQTLSTSVYAVDTASQPGRIFLKPDQSWPSLDGSRATWRVEVTYVVGWTTVADVPAMFKLGTLMTVVHNFENRSAVQVGVGLSAVEIPMGVSTYWGDQVYWTPEVCV
jgi:uncharacterized phiE125 gp8 family phage protein